MFRVSNRLVIMLTNMPKTSERAFNYKNMNAIGRAFGRQPED
jgi:hypothetical protein